jgi:hypothetical protein
MENAFTIVVIFLGIFSVMGFIALILGHFLVDKKQSET